MSIKTSGGGRKWKSRSCKIAAKQEKIKKKISAKYDRLVQELWALESDWWDSQGWGGESTVDCSSRSQSLFLSLGHVIKVAKPKLEDFRKLRKC